MGMKLSKKQLAEMFDTSERTLTDWQEKGMPIEKDSGRGKRNVYDSAACIEWRQNQLMAGKERETSRDRRDRLQGDLIEMQMAEKAGLLVPAAEVAQALSSVVHGCRSILLIAGEKLKAELDARHDIDVDADLINEHFRDVLTKLAEIQPDDAGEGDPGSAGAVSSAA